MKYLQARFICVAMLEFLNAPPALAALIKITANNEEAINGFGKSVDVSAGA